MNDYYFCAFCGLELFDDDVDVKVSATYPSGTYAYCPECGKENALEFEAEFTD